jgi:signal transduction histidine kinase
LKLLVIEDDEKVSRALRPGLQPGRGGLGLAMVRAVIERHGGTVDVDADYTPGTRLVIRLPVAT